MQADVNMVGDGKPVTTQLRGPMDASVRWKLAHTGNGAF